jgi:hypothetical protein
VLLFADRYSLIDPPLRRQAFAFPNNEQRPTNNAFCDLGFADWDFRALHPESARGG